VGEKSLNIDIEPTEPVFTIGIVAKLLNISTESIRAYDRAHLIIPHRSKSGHRFFSKMDIKWIHCFHQYMINGVLHIYDIQKYLAQFSCHSLKHCSIKIKKQCLVYNNPNQICWAAIACPNRKSERNYCRECVVYKHICTIKILNYANPSTPIHKN